MMLLTGKQGHYQEHFDGGRWLCQVSPPTKVEFDSSEVVRFGKLRSYGNFLTVFVLCVAGNDAPIFVKANQQGTDAQKWLRKVSKRCGSAELPAGVGQFIKWLDLGNSSP